VRWIDVERKETMGAFDRETCRQVKTLQSVIGKAKRVHITKTSGAADYTCTRTYTCTHSCVCACAHTHARSHALARARTRARMRMLNAFAYIHAHARMHACKDTYMQA
jgi:hypothetical protein